MERKDKGKLTGVIHTISFKINENRKVLGASRK